MLYAFGKWITYVYVRLFYRMRYEGLENIPDYGFILASNHRSNNDPLFIAHKIPVPVHYMAKAELFRRTLFGWILRHINAFPVARGTGDTTAIDTAKDILASGEVLGMFPEGRRSRDGRPQRARSGVALIAGQTGAVVLPCAICYGERLRFRSQVTVRYGKPISVATLGIDPAQSATVRDAARRIMEDIVGLLEQGV